MLRRFSIVSLLILVATVGMAADRTVTLDLHRGEWISDAVVNDDQSARLFVASNDPRQTRVIDIKPDGSRAALTVGGLSINHVQTLRDSSQTATYFVGAAFGTKADNDYRFLLVRIDAGKKLVTLWDSSQLPETVRKSEPWMSASEDGKTWTAISENAKEGGFTLSWGSFDDPKKFARVSMSAIQPPAVRPGFTFDSPTASVFTRAGKTIGAAMWRGRAFLFDLSPRENTHSSRLLNVLAPPLGGSLVTYQPSTDTLWIGGGREYTAFDLSQSLSQSKGPAAPTKRVPVQSATAHTTQGFALANGGFILRSADASGSFLQSLPAGADTPKSLSVRGKPVSTFKTSPMGRVVLVEPDGPRSTSVHLVTMD